MNSMCWCVCINFLLQVNVVTAWAETLPLLLYIKEKLPEIDANFLEQYFKEATWIEKEPLLHQVTQLSLSFLFVRGGDVISFMELSWEGNEWMKCHVPVWHSLSGSHYSWCRIYSFLYTCWGLCLLQFFFFLSCSHVIHTCSMAPIFWVSVIFTFLNAIKAPGRREAWCSLHCAGEERYIERRA